MSMVLQGGFKLNPLFQDRVDCQASFQAQDVYQSCFPTGLLLSLNELSFVIYIT